MTKIRVLLLPLVLCMATVGWTQDRYTQGMQKAFQLWGEGNSTEAVHLFERIATAEMDNWIPHYYVAFVSTMDAFQEKDAKVLEQKLGKAQEYVDLAKAISPDNPEILVLQAMVHTAWVAFDGATYGMTLSGKVVQLYEKAAALAPENPRVVYCRAEWNMGSARYFGNDITPYCKEIDRSLELFANFKPEGPFFPDWGKERAEQLSGQCKK